jgi:hypothetical protein
VRELAKEFNSGELHMFLNTGVKAGDCTDIHQHDYPHTLFAVTPVKLEVWLDDEVRVVAADLGSHFYTVQAGRAHRLTFLTDNGAFYCTFSRWGASGYRPDPKRWTGNPEPVTI